LDYVKWIVFPANEAKGQEVTVGSRSFKAYAEIEPLYLSGEIQPADIKQTLKVSINALIQPVRDHFAKDPAAAELLQKVRAYRTTK